MLNHFGFGYQYYADDLLGTNARIFALRQEHLSTDWIRMNLRLGGSFHEVGGNVKIFQDKLTVRKPPRDFTTANELRGLCMALAEEIRTWWAVIHAAHNLTEFEKQESKKDIHAQCGEGVV